MMSGAIKVHHRHLITYRLALIADAHNRAIRRMEKKTMALSETQISILARGHETSPFKLDRSVGRALGKMLNDGLMQPGGKKGEWDLTDKGRAAFATHLAQQAAANDQVYKETESSINLDDPALKPAFEVLDFTASPDAVARVVSENEAYKARIKSLNASLDDMGRLADDLAKKVKTLETATTRIEGEDTADTTARIIVEALLKMKTEDDSHLTLIAYVDDLRQKAATVDQAAIAVEALRRQLDQAHLDLNIAERHAALHEMDEFLVCVLDELAQADPLIKTIRDGRVTAQRALMQIKDRR